MNPATAPKKLAADWRQLAGDGSYGLALADAKQRGFKGLLNSSNSEDLVLLANCARLAGDPTSATQAYLSVRRRFAGSHHAALAAFMLGRLAFDYNGAYATSAKWYRTYLNERPSGGLAHAALGRLMESLQRLGDPKAQALALKYQKRYPHGPHAKLAQQITTVKRP